MGYIMRYFAECLVFDMMVLWEFSAEYGELVKSLLSAFAVAVR
jgi:hypothetical protein